MRELAKCFYQVFDKSKPYTVMDAGLRVVEVRRITGTLDKCGELDSTFRYIKRHDRGERSRWHRLSEAAKSYHFFPPIEVVLYRGEYYVIDGNRRVAVAKALKIEYIDAYVKEYILRDDAEFAAGALSRRRFESQTGLKNVNLYFETGYTLLIEEILERTGSAGKKGKRDLEAHARKWYSEVFIPACSEIAKSELPQWYPDITLGDIFVLILRFYREFLGKLPTFLGGLPESLSRRPEFRGRPPESLSGLPRNVSFQTMISGYMFARKLPERRFWRFFPFRILQTLITGRGEKDGFVPDGNRNRKQ